MDEIRSILNAMQAEDGLLADQTCAEINAIRQRDYLIIFLTLILALGFRLIMASLYTTVLGRGSSNS